MRRFSYIALLLGVVSLAGCASGGNAPAAKSSYVSPPAGPFVYVIDGGANVVRLPQPSNGVVMPLGVAPAPADVPGSITVYAAGATWNAAPAQTETNVIGPIGISL